MVVPLGSDFGTPRPAAPGKKKPGELAGLNRLRGRAIREESRCGIRKDRRECLTVGRQSWVVPTSHAHDFTQAVGA